ncbi:cilia- and flagella-associated protein 97 isoform X3 [Pseudophryne corroboree]|uniref:cilia- and flagella-associated protein 97 isoform X3 n=1 Tax=Pseudophryne corroboree TaxID=495146 RepID=UPI0030814693
MDRYDNLSDEGEVDHSFFDSDADDEAGRQVISTSEPSKREHTQAFGSGESKRVAETNHGAGKEVSKEKSKEPMSSPDSSRPSSAVKSGRSSAQSSRFGTTIPTGIPQIRHEFEDNYYPDEDDSSEEESRSLRPKTAKQTNIGKKNTKYSRDFPSSISSSDTEFSDTASDDHKSKPHISLKERTLFSLGSPERRFSKQPTKDHTDESEDTVTDVTPLSTPDISPIQSFDIAATSEALKSKVKRQENVSQEIYDPVINGRADPKTLQDAMDLNQLLKVSVPLEFTVYALYSWKTSTVYGLKSLLKITRAFMHLDKTEQKSLSLEHPPSRHKKNYSFTNDEVRYIDRENQRLLKELSRQSKPKSQSITPKKLNPTPSRLYHSALNRQREQQRIERENLETKIVRYPQQDHSLTKLTTRPC